MNIIIMKLLVSVKQHLIIIKFSFICCQMNILYKNRKVNCFSSTGEITLIFSTLK